MMVTASLFQGVNAMAQVIYDWDKSPAPAVANVVSLSGFQ